MSGTGLQTHLPTREFRKFSGPVVDVRSPAEFKKGHWPGAVNVPLFNDLERASIGTTYKKIGRDEAVLEGIEYVTSKLLLLGKSLENTLQSFAKKSEEPNSCCLRIYCWRGGMRSASVAWLAELNGLKSIVLREGYKSYRKWVLDQFNIKWPLQLLGGRTGTGKTDLLKEFTSSGRSVIDLEGLANHRGSSFGALGLPDQPTTEHYENLIAEDLEKFLKLGSNQIWIEAESSNLGKCRIPSGLFNQMKTAPLLEICRSKKERVQQLVEVYGVHSCEALTEATDRINRRLGPQRTTLALKAIKSHNWAEACEVILDYYDRCYDHELNKKPNRQTEDLTGLSTKQSLEKLLKAGLIE